MAGIAVLDFGSQVTQLIARRLRQLNYYSEIFPFDVDIERIKKMQPEGIILSGGPSSVYDEGAPSRSLAELKALAPLMGICYGMQLIAKEFGGKVTGATEREYGLNQVKWSKTLGQTPQLQKVWMSHGDVIESAPSGFEIIGHSAGGHPAAMRGPGVLAVQFHPEVTHTDQGNEIFKEFLENYCHAKSEWTAPHVKQHLLQSIRDKVGSTGKVLCALSGGVDSTVVGTLLTQALGAERVHCIFVDTGLLRHGEFSDVLAMYEKIGLNVRGIDASEQFFKALNGLADPELKRKAIGRTFIEVFQESTKDLGGKIDFLAQGTLYPDVIESVSLRGASVTIKSHHNVGGLPEKMQLKLIEPLRELFKDEVRALGKELGLAHDVLWRHPFPGPGLAIRILGEVTRADVKTLQECDRIYIEELRKQGLYSQIWQAFCVLLPVRTVGVQGDGRTYDKVLALRAVTSQDGMTADWFDFPASFLRQVSNRITNEVKGVNRVVYDVTSKPPGTIEWE